MTLAEIQRIQLATRYFQALQGLKNLVPAGLGIAGLGLLSMIPARPLRPPWAFAVDFLLTILVGFAWFVAAIFAYLRAGLYYRRTFGDVEDRPVRPSRLSTLAIVMLTLLGLAMVFLLMLLQAAYGVPFIAVLCGANLIYPWLATGRRLAWVHRLPLGLLLLGFVAPAAAGLFGPSIRIGKGIPAIVSGLAIVVAGLLDHHRLVQAMRPPGAPPWEGDATPSLEVQR